MSEPNHVTIDQIYQWQSEGVPLPVMVTDTLSAYEAKCAEVDVANIAAAEWREKLAHVMVSRDMYRTLAGIGAWHEDCRPNREMAARELQKSQAIIDKLADEIAEKNRAYEAMQQERDAALRALRTYGHHKAQCAMRNFSTARWPECNCGLFVALSASSTPDSNRKSTTI